MSDRQNCWQFMACGRQPGGGKVADLGPCPAAEAVSCDGVNAGTRGGRICWAVTGTLCGGKVQGSFAHKQLSCLDCEFLRTVREEEGRRFVFLRPNQDIESIIRENDERVRHTLDVIPIGLYRATVRGQFLDVNAALVEMLGYGDRETLLAVTRADLHVLPEDLAVWCEEMANLGEVRDCDIQLWRADGSTIWARDRAKAVTDDRGRVLYCEGTLRDIADAKRTELRLTEYEAHIEELVQARAAELAAADRLIQAATAIAGSAGSATSGTLAAMCAELKEPLQEIVRCGERLAADAERIGRPEFTDEVARIREAGLRLLSLCQTVDAVTRPKGPAQ